VPDDWRDLAALYDQMSVADLRRLQTAFRLDLQAAQQPETLAFCGARLALIEAALRAAPSQKKSPQ
jgi:hypothetical protein